ncbi:hypothetical protein HK102_003551 [Quaeritorhiza haematococci]|nr:hypothetical protein HK102_003551 [Quaeritorhiza haematococci]
MAAFCIQFPKLHLVLFTMAIFLSPSAAIALGPGVNTQSTPGQGFPPPQAPGGAFPPPQVPGGAFPPPQAPGGSFPQPQAPGAFPQPQIPGANPTPVLPGGPAPVIEPVIAPGSTPIFTPTIGFPGAIPSNGVGFPVVATPGVQGQVAGAPISAASSMQRASGFEFVGVVGAVIVGMWGYFGVF